MSLSFDISTGGLTFNIDKTREVPDIGYDIIRDSTEQFEGVLEMIFSSVIHVEYRGARTILTFINADNIRVVEYKFHTGLWPSWFSASTTKIFEPYFEV